ncbi:TniQ family protein [Rhodobacteraceae bacterium F11138]|nr:TniQ family protein [Rhodobacteraceae bacterium F11138]
MTAVVLTPHLPFHDDEVSQGYFARNGYYHAGVSAGKFCRYSRVNRADFRAGTDAFCVATASLTGVPDEQVQMNALRVEADGSLCLRGERLAVEVVRRTYVRFCPHCLSEDTAAHSGKGDGAMRLRWTWLLRPVVACPIHGMTLQEVAAPDPVNAFDLGRLFAQSNTRPEEMRSPADAKAGVLQRYVVNRLSDRATGPKWLDDQEIWPCVKVCQMLGALIDDGPNARIHGYTEEDWVRAGDIGFDICTKGEESILDVLSEKRVSSGRSSGRAGPQAAYGFLFNWLSRTGRANKFRLFRDIVREAIVRNFPIGAGDTVLGREITTRRVHSVNSLAAKAGISRFRLYRLMRKVGAIPTTADQAAFNQWVFSAEEGEHLVARVQNSVPLNKVQHVLGCSKTHAEQLAEHGLISSVVPIADEKVGVTQGYFNLEDLDEFKSAVFRSTHVSASEKVDFVDLTVAVKGRSSTAELIQWHLDGKLPGTLLIGGVRRLDHLRFDLDRVRELAENEHLGEHHRLTTVALMLGINLKAVKKLTTARDGGPWLTLAPACITRSLRGEAYVSATELERFQADFLSIALIARQVGGHYRAVQAALDRRGIEPVFEPAWLGARIYRKEDVSDFIAERDRAGVAHDDRRECTGTETDVNFASDTEGSAEEDVFCESDGVTL